MAVVRRHDEDRVALGVGLRDRVLDQVVGRRRLGDGGQDGRLGDRQLGEVGDPEVDLGGRGDAVALVAVEVLVEVGGHDGLLALVAGKLLGQADRLDDLLDLALVGGAGERTLGEQAGADELLRDRGGAARPAAQGVVGGGDDGHRIEARVLPERVVLDARRGVDEDRRDLAVVEDDALLLPEAGQLDLARGVVDDGLLVERQPGELRLGIRQALAVIGIGADGGDHSDEADQQEDAEEDERECDGDGCGHATCTAALALTVATVALAPREAEFHSVLHDSIGGMTTLPEAMDGRAVGPCQP